MDGPSEPAPGTSGGGIDRSLVDLTVLAVLGRAEGLVLWRRALPGLPDARHREALLQVHLFAGFPRVVEAFTLLEREGGLGVPEAEETPLGGPDPVRGRGFFDRIYGPRSGAVAAALESFHPELAGWILGHAYGRVLTRTGLSALQRELLAVVALIATDQDRQLASHVRGAANLGAGPLDFQGLLEQLGSHLPAEQLERAARVVERFGPQIARGDPARESGEPF